jgi:hypothetical protein
VIAEHAAKRGTSILTVGRNLPTRISAPLTGKVQTTQKQLILQLTINLLDITVTIVIKMATLRTAVIKRNAT